MKRKNKICIKELPRIKASKHSATFVKQSEGRDKAATFEKQLLSFAFSRGKAKLVAEKFFQAASLLTP